MASAAALIVATAGCGFLDNVPDRGPEVPPEIMESTPSGPAAEDWIPVEAKLVFPKRADLKFGVPGRVGQVLVTEGQQVEKGEVMATLDALTVAEFERQSAQQDLALVTALDTFADYQRSHRQQLALARQAVAQAELQLDQAQTRQEDFQTDLQLKLAQGKRSKAAADLNLDKTQQDLEDFQSDHARMLAQAVDNRANAETGLEQARQTLEDFQRRHELQLVGARQSVADGELALKGALDALSAHVPTHAADVANAIQFRTDAYQALRQAEKALEDFEADTGAQSALVQRSLADLTRDLEDAEDSLQTYVFRITNTPVHGPEVETLLEELHRAVAEAEDRVSAAAGVIAQLRISTAGRPCLEEGPDLLMQRCQQLKATIVAALANLEIAERDLAVLQGEAGEVELAKSRGELVLQQLQARVGAAQAVLDEARLDLAELEEGPDQLDLAALESRVNLSRENLAAAEREIDRLSDGPDPLERAVKESALGVARTAVQQAETSLASLETNQDRLEMALRQKQVELAQQEVAKAAKDLATLERGPDQSYSSVLRAQLSWAKLAADESRKDLEGTLIVAPFAGVVSLINAEPDDNVTDESRILSLVDSGLVEVHGLVNASVIRKVKHGAEARVTIDSLSGSPLNGEVTAVAEKPKTDRGVLTFLIVVAVNIPGNLEVPLKLSGVTLSVSAGR